MSSRLQDIAMKRKINGLIKLLSEASETPATITPDLSTFDQQLTQAPDAAQISVPNKDLTFAKRDGQWYVTGAGISDAKLRSILLPAGQKKLDRASQGTNVNFEAADFIEPVKAVNFTRDQPGTAWRDNTPIEPAIIKKYMFGAAVSDIGLSAASPGNVLVHRDENLNYVLLGSTFNVMAPGRDLSATNPLEAAKQLLIRAGFDSQFNITTPPRPPTNFIDVIDNKEELSLNLDRLGEAGALRDALGSVRTLVGKFADLFNQDDIKVNFEVTEFGPALTRRKVAGRSTEALTAGDAEKLEKTDYFKYESLPSARPATYKIGNNGSGVAEVTVSGVTVTGLDGVTDPSGAKITNTFGSALYLYIKGRLKFSGETQYSATPSPSAPPVDEGQTPEARWEAYIKILLTEGDWGWTMIAPNSRPGGLFFEFNADKSNKEIPADYITATNEKIKNIKKDFDEIFKSFETNKRPPIGISVLAIATGDPIGSPQQNNLVSNRRVEALSGKIDTSLGVVLVQPTGESPWANITDLQNLSAATANNKDKLKGARFGTTIFKRTAASIDPNDIARKFYEAHSASLEESIGSYRSNLINEIRRIIKETK